MPLHPSNNRKIYFQSDVKYNKTRLFIISYCDVIINLLFCLFVCLFVAVQFWLVMMLFENYVWVIFLLLVIHQMKILNMKASEMMFSMNIQMKGSKLSVISLASIRYESFMSSVTIWHVLDVKMCRIPDVASM